jgi:hypothetical protein
MLAPRTRIYIIIWVSGRNHETLGNLFLSLIFQDIRDYKNCKVQFEPKSESVKDVVFSKHYPNYFAAAFDNGTVQVSAIIP